MAFETEHHRQESSDVPEERPSEPSVDPRELVHAAADFARESPHAAVGAALAVGFVLGGGLTPRLLASLAMHFGRKYLAEAARQAMEGAVEGEIAGERAA
jgi:hypothetical protein